MGLLRKPISIDRKHKYSGALLVQQNGEWIPVKDTRNLSWIYENNKERHPNSAK